MADDAQARPVTVAEDEFGAFEPPPALPKTAQALAEKAKDLLALREAVVEAAGVSGPLWMSYLGALFYLAVAAGAVTHKDLFLEHPVKLPFLGVDLPLAGFFALGPAFFLILHVYVLLHFVLLAGKVRAFHSALQDQIVGEANATTRDNLRRQLPSNIFIQFLAGPRDVREGWVGRALRGIAWISLVFGPVLLLVFFQFRCLPYHDVPLTYWHRIAVVIDVALLWWLWPQIVLAPGDGGGTRWARGGAWAMKSGAVLLVLLVWRVATFPGERLHEVPGPAGWIPRGIVTFLGVELKHGEWGSLHDILFDGRVDQVNRRPTSLFANVLVLPGVEAYDPTKFDDDKKFAAVRQTVSLRGRHLEGAVLTDALLRKVDLTGAFLQGAKLGGAELRGAILGCAVRGDGGMPRKGCAQLQGASLVGAELQGASLDFAHLQGASLNRAQLQGVSLNGACVWRADIHQATADATWVMDPRIWAVSPVDDDARSDGCDWTAARTAALRAAIEQDVPPGRQRDDALRRLDSRLLPDPPEQGEDEEAMAGAGTPFA